MNLPEEKFAELLDIIRKISGEYTLTLTRDTLIEEELGVCGDDAIELILTVSKCFNVEISGFNFSKYFNDEPNPFYNSNKILVPFTIAYLERAIIAGKLD
ncbi:MAG: DUF1493 family protein [Filimonas sp.]|nr:DUF1493 family protein [Filimonas sp.]